MQATGGRIRDRVFSDYAEWTSRRRDNQICRGKQYRLDCYGTYWQIRRSRFNPRECLAEGLCPQQMFCGDSEIASGARSIPGKSPEAALSGLATHFPWGKREVA